MVRHIQYVKTSKESQLWKVFRTYQKERTAVNINCRNSKMEKEIEKKKIQHTVTNKIRKIYVYE